MPARGVAEACLDLQERRGCDVNILLFCCWLGASGRPTLTADRLRAILKASDVWQAEIVRPLRQVRRLLKDRPWPEALPETVDAVRRRVADAELAAEHAEQIKLASLHTPPGRPRPAASKSGCARRSAISASTPSASASCPTPGPRRGGGADEGDLSDAAPRRDRARAVGLRLNRATASITRPWKAQRSAPALDLAGVEIEQVEHAADRVVDHVVERLGLVVEGGHRRGDDGAHLRQRRPCSGDGWRAAASRAPSAPACGAPSAPRRRRGSAGWR